MILEQFKPAAQPILRRLSSPSGADGALTDAALQGALLGGTMVATDNGWRGAETLKPGNRVLTFQNGFRMLRKVERHRMPLAGDLPEDLQPLRVAPNVLGNVIEVMLMPGQIVLRDADAEGNAQEPELVEASTMFSEGAAKRFQPPRELAFTRLCFDETQLICANYGAVMLCTRACDTGRKIAGSARGQLALSSISEELVSNLFGTCKIGAKAEALA